MNISDLSLKSLSSGELPRITVASVVEKDRQFLIVEEYIRKELKLNQPAGHLDPNETLIQAALRETLEETGWTVEITDLIGIYHIQNTFKSPVMRFAFVARPIQFNENYVIDPDIDRAVWLDAETIFARHVEHRSSVVSETLTDYLNGQRYPLDIFK